MPVLRYSVTLRTLRERLLSRFPGAEAVEGATQDVNHTLWMIEQVGHMGDQPKIDRWVGWIGAKAHSLGVIDGGDDTLAELRELIRRDLA
jgi:hypothetical protein